MPDNNVIGLEGISKILHTFYRHCCQQKVTFCRCQAISDFSLTSWEETERGFLQVLFFLFSQNKSNYCALHSIRGTLKGCRKQCHLCYDNDVESLSSTPPIPSNPPKNNPEFDVSSLHCPRGISLSLLTEFRPLASSSDNFLKSLFRMSVPRFRLLNHFH